LTSPIVPDQGYSETLSFQNDPDFKVGRSHMIDFTIQRTLPAGMILEVGYVGRLGRHLPASVNFNSVPYMFKDKISGQTFAQAFDSVATEIRAGTDASLVAAQPWFENLLPGFGGQCAPALSATACFASQNSSAFANLNLSSLFLNMDVYRAFQKSLPAFDDTQVVDLFTRYSRDSSNYSALVVDVRNNAWHGLLFDFNYTFSKSLDTVGAVQNDARYYSSSFNPHLDYGPSFFNRPHVFNAIFNYELPFKNHRSFVNKIIGGWYTSGIFRASSGVPELVTISGQPFGGGLIFGTPSGEIATAPVNTLGGGSVHSGVCSAGAGSSGNGPDCSTPGTGTGLNYFGDPAAAVAKFRPALLATDTNDGRNNPLQGLGFWNLDLGFGKSTTIAEYIKADFSFNCFNVFNHTNFLDPSFDVTNPSAFGVINTQLIPADRLSGSRWIQFAFRISF